MADGVPIKKLILVPAVVTLGVTLLRLAGELLHWSPVLFSREAGGGGAIVGIAWLVPIFGAYFGWTLARAGHGPAGVGAAIGFAVLGFALLPASGFLAVALGVPQQSLTMLAVFVVVSVVAAAVAYRGWPALGRTLLAYGLAARVPVVLVMLAAMAGSWGTHYDAVPPGFPEMGVIPKWLYIGVAPQLTIWVWYTIAVGGFLGGIAAAIARRSHQPA